MLKYYLMHQEDVVTRRTKYDLNKAEERAHILEGLIIALDNIDRVISIIRGSENVQTARESLMKEFNLTEAQSQAIVDMRLRALTGLERSKIEAELAELQKKIDEYKAILADKNKLLTVIKTEISIIADKYGDDRRTSIGFDEYDISMEDLIPDEPCVIARTNMGYVKRMTPDNFKSQHRGGKGIKGMQTLEEDYIEDLFMTTSHHVLTFFTNTGRAYKLKAYEIPEANTIGTGNIIGVGSAIALGGPGAVFWMWVIGFVAMALKYSEALLGVYTREKDANGQWRGGANIYLAKIWKPLGWIWAITCCFGMAIGCGVHTGAISSSVHTFGVPSLITTVVCCVIIVLVILGGLGALVKVTDKLVPAMAIIYMAAGTLLIILNIQNLIPALISVFTNAFTGTAATGGFAGAALAATIKNGCSRGVYSNDGGNGSASILHAQANTNEPVKQGMFGIFEVFMCTMIICTFSAMVILVTGTWETGDPGSVLAINAFGTIGLPGRLLASISLILFAASSALSMSTSAGILAESLLGKAAKRIMQILVVVCCFIGGTIGVDAALPWVDFGNMWAILVHVIGIMFWVPKMRELTLDFFDRLKKGEIRE